MSATASRRHAVDEAGAGAVALLRAEAPALLALTLLAWLPVAVLGVGGDFPLNDDWAYARTVETWLETGRFARPSWTWAPSFSNALVGVAFARVLGFSHEALRWSGITLGWVGVLATYGLARRVGAGRAAALLAGVALAANPVHVNLAWTFMTDVPFAAFSTLALLGLAGGLRRRAALPLALGALFALAAMLSRAPGLALPLAAGAAVLFVHPPRPRVWLAAAAGALLLAGLYAALPHLLYDASDSGRHLRLGWYVREKLLDGDVLYFVTRSALGSAPLLGLFLLPAVASRATAVARPRLALAGGALVAAGGLAVAHRLALTPPFSVNVIWNFGLGSRGMAGWEELPSLPLAPWWAASGFGLAVAGFALVGGAATAWERRRALAGRVDLALLALFPLIYLGGLAVQWPFFDRWLLPALPPLLALWLAVVPRPATPTRPGRAVAALALALLGAYAVLGTRDALALQRARWALLDDLVARGVPRDRIDGGFEFNGWYHYDPDPSRFLDRPGVAWVLDDTWRLSMAPAIPGYRRIATRRVPRWLPPGELAVHVHRRIEEPAPPAPAAEGASGARASDAWPAPLERAAPRQRPRAGDAG